MRSEPYTQGQMQMAAGSEIARRVAAGRRHDPQRRLAAVRLARLVDAEEGDVLAVGRPGDVAARAGQTGELDRLAAARGHGVDGRRGGEVGALARIGA